MFPSLICFFTTWAFVKPTNKNNIVYCGFATNCLARSLRSHHHPVNSKSDNIPARSFAALICRLPSSQLLAYIIARLRLAFFEARTILFPHLHKQN